MLTMSPPRPFCGGPQPGEQAADVLCARLRPDWCRGQLQCRVRDAGARRRVAERARRLVVARHCVRCGWGRQPALAAIAAGARGEPRGRRLRAPSRGPDAVAARAADVVRSELTAVSCRGRGVGTETSGMSAAKVGPISSEL